MHVIRFTDLRWIWPVTLAIAACACSSFTFAADDAEAERARLKPVVVGAPTRIEVWPATIRLDDPRRRMHVIVSGHYADGAVRDLTRVAEFSAADPDVVEIQQRVVTPKGDGQTELVVSVGGHRVQVPVEVTGHDQPAPVSFNYGTLVALSKQGCNSGSCHGAPSGKGGFRMSLRAYDPALDRETLIREEFGRRTNTYDPARSLLLRKPTMDLAHGGGRRLRVDDPAYQLLHDWIAEGCRVDSADALRCVKVDVYPRDRILHAPAHAQQLLVLAEFSDRSVRDITDLAVYTSSDEAVATVDARGLVTAEQRGETAILVRYLEKMETAHLTYLQDVEGFQWSDPPAENFVDEKVLAKLRQMQIMPSDVCTDDEFIRRVYLDVIGLLPNNDEVERFLSDDDTGKRADLIDALLERPEFARFWALKWGDLMRLGNKRVTPQGVHKFYRWLVDAVATNKPYDQFSRELLTAAGSTYENPPANFYRTAADTDDCTETTSQLFLGIRIQCAKCHNHPFERWTQDNYYGIGAFFNRVSRKESPADGEMVVWVARAGEVIQPRTGRQMQPWLPLVGEAEASGEDDRRLRFADWLTDPQNPFFARVEANRIWGHLTGRGIVDPVDDFRASNPPSNEALLDALAEEFVKSGYDRKHLIRTILNSSTYQLSSRKNEFNAEDDKYFSHAGVRMLSAEQLLDAICQVTGVAEQFKGLPSGTPATQLPSPDVDSEFLKTFGQPPRETACQCERATESNLSQALQLINGPLVHGKLRDENNRLRKLVAAGKSDREIVHELYTAAFCRPPSDEEVRAAEAHVERAENRIDGLEDVCWALLNANEFLFQH